MIHVLSGKHAQQLERAVHAATVVFYEFPSYQVLLRQFWLGKHEGNIPEEVLLRYQELRYPPREPEEEPDEAA